MLVSRMTVDEEEDVQQELLQLQEQALPVCLASSLGAPIANRCSFLDDTTQSGHRHRTRQASLCT